MGSNFSINIVYQSENKVFGNNAHEKKYRSVFLSQENLFVVFEVKNIDITYNRNYKKEINTFEYSLSSIISSHIAYIYYEHPSTHIYKK